MSAQAIPEPIRRGLDDVAESRWRAVADDALLGQMAASDPVGTPGDLSHVTDTFLSAWPPSSHPLRDLVTVMHGIEREPRHPAYRATPVPDCSAKIAHLTPDLRAAFTLSVPGVSGYGLVWLALLD